MVFCHLENSELEPQYQKYSGRVVLPGDIVKDDSGSYAVFTEQASSASQMTAAKVMDILSKLPGCAGQAADAVSAPRSKWKMHQRYYKNPQSECPDIWIRLPKHKWPKSWPSMEDPVCSSRAESVRSSFGRTFMGKAIRERSIQNTVGKKFRIGMFIRQRRKRTTFICVCGRYQIGWEKSRRWFWENQHHFLTMYIWVALKESVKLVTILWQAT